MIWVADQFDAKQYASERDFIGALLGAAKIVGRQRGWKGFFLIEARWEDGQAVIGLGPGHSDIGPAQVGDMLRAQRKAAA